METDKILISRKPQDFLITDQSGIHSTLFTGEITAKEFLAQTKVNGEVELKSYYAFLLIPEDKDSNILPNPLAFYYNLDDVKNAWEEFCVTYSRFMNGYNVARFQFPSAYGCDFDHLLEEYFIYLDISKNLMEYSYKIPTLDNKFFNTNGELKEEYVTLYEKTFSSLTF